MDLIKEGLKYPHFWVEEKTKNYRNSFLGEEKDRYEIYSLLAWNICESVYDRKKIDKTWLPAIETQKKLHFRWLEDNSSRFKGEFVDYIREEPLRQRKGLW
jgi:hypothetical protein